MILAAPLHRRPAALVAVVLLLLAIGALGGLVAGGALNPFGSSGDRAHATDRPGTSPPTAVPTAPPPTPGPATLQQGLVVADEAAGELTGPVALGRTRSTDGAASAFSSYAAWLLGSPAAGSDPVAAARTVGTRLLDPTDARLLADLQRHPSDAFEVAQGAYRVLGHAGDRARPDQVMVEVTAPLTLDGRKTWRTVGGVVGWTAQGWQLVSIRPQQVAQPESGHDDVRDFGRTERGRVLPGLGWHAFRVPAGR